MKTFIISFDSARRLGKFSKLNKHAIHASGFAVGPTDGSSIGMLGLDVSNHVSVAN